MSNDIVLRVMTGGRGARVLVDRNLHQSIHLTLMDLGAHVDYIPRLDLDSQYRLKTLDVETLIGKLKAADDEGNPYQLLIINGQSYEGIVNNIPYILSKIVESGARLEQIFVDEAWGAANAFHPLLAEYSAMTAARLDIVRNAGIAVVSTQSAHKSLSALRQASMIHIAGSRKLADDLRKGRYRFHTTSPSTLILASLDLARAQAQAEASEMLDRSITLAQSLRDEVGTRPLASAFDVVDLDPVCTKHRHVAPDKTKVLLRSRDPALTGMILRERLYEDFGIYVSRTFENAILLNFHIGIHRDDLEALVNALMKIATVQSTVGFDGTANDYIIAYPPGVPLAVPGEIICPEILSQMHAERQSGSRILTVSGK